MRGLYSRGSSQKEISIRKSKQLAEVKELDHMYDRGMFDYVFNNGFTEKSKQDFWALVDTIILKIEGILNEH